MQDFARELDQLLSMVPAPLEPLPPGDYVIYGAGNIGREVASRLSGSDKNVRAFLDRRDLGSVDGIPVYSPGSAEARKLAGEGTTAVVGVFNYAADPHEIQMLLTGLGFRRVVSFLELREHVPLPPHFWLSSRRHVLDCRERIAAAGMLLDDDKSRHVYLDWLRLRLHMDTSLLRNPDLDQQYLPDDLPRPKQPMRFIDGGTFNGDTIEFFLRKGVIFEAVAAFEPDRENFRALCDTAHKLEGRLGVASYWPCGLGDATSIAQFCAGRDMASVVSGHGDTPVELAALDRALPHFRPTFIKLDIEGSELAALRGGREIIQKNQPVLAVCVYHRPEDLWEIPLYLRELLPGHRIALRYHKYYALETVAYAMLPS